MLQSYETPRPDQLVDPYLTEVFYPGVQLTCGAVADIALTGSLSIPDHFTLCGGIQATGVHCGCTPPDPAGACSVCSTPLSEESRAHHVGFSAPLDVVSCGLVELMGDLFDNGNGMVEHGVEQAGFTADAICNLYQYAGYLCGCNDSVFTYWGAETLPKQKAGIWIQRVTAILSLVGSFAIIFDIVKLQKFKTNMYHQIMLCLSLCDSISSLAWGLGPLPTANVTESLGIEIYPYIPDDSILGFYGSHGVRIPQESRNTIPMLFRPLNNRSLDRCNMQGAGVHAASRIYIDSLVQCSIIILFQAIVYQWVERKQLHFAISNYLSRVSSNSLHCFSLRGFAIHHFYTNSMLDGILQ